MLKVNLAQQKWQKELEKLDVALERWDEASSVFSVQCSPILGKWQSVLGVPWPRYGAHEVEWQGSR